jgi:hypothetical protein
MPRFKQLFMAWRESLPCLSLPPSSALQWYGEYWLFLSPLRGFGYGFYALGIRVKKGVITWIKHVDITMARVVLTKIPAHGTENLVYKITINII